MWSHYGVRTERHKLIFYYAGGLGMDGNSAENFEPEWELFDLHADPRELNSVYDDPSYADGRDKLMTELVVAQRSYGDTRWNPNVDPWGTYTDSSRMP